MVTVQWSGARGEAFRDRTTYQGGPARFLKVYVPRAARSGWVFVKAHGLESNPVWLEIT